VTPPDYDYLRKLLKEHSGLDLSADKQYLIESRLLPLSRKCGLPGISELVLKMKGGSAAIITQVVEAMTTNETFFFRDKVPFDHFRDTIMPEILRARASRRSAAGRAAVRCARTRTFSTRGSRVPCGRSRRSAGPSRRTRCVPSTRPMSSLRRARSSSCGSPG